MTLSTTVLFSQPLLNPYVLHMPTKLLQFVGASPHLATQIRSLRPQKKQFLPHPVQALYVKLVSAFVQAWGCCFAFAGMRQIDVSSWDELKQHDILFLLTIRPLAAEVEGQHVDVAYVRGCEIIEVKDEGELAGGIPSGRGVFMLGDYQSNLIGNRVLMQANGVSQWTFLTRPRFEPHPSCFALLVKVFWSLYICFLISSSFRHLILVSTKIQVRHQFPMPNHIEKLLTLAMNDPNPLSPHMKL